MKVFVYLNIAKERKKNESVENEKKYRGNSFKKEERNEGRRRQI